MGEAEGGDDPAEACEEQAAVERVEDKFTVIALVAKGRRGEVLPELFGVSRL